MGKGWIVLVGQGFPTRISNDDWAVAWFPDEAAALAWVAAHPKAKNAQPIDLREYHA